LPLTKERKQELIEEYVDLLERSNAIIVAEYRGLTNADMTRLRRALRESQGVFRVTKLTLFKRALAQVGYPLPEQLSGTPLAIGFCLDEVPGVAKALADFAKDSEALVVRAGLMSGAVLNAKQVEALATLPPLDVLQAQILGLLDAPAANLVGVIQAGVGQIVNVLHAYVEQAEAA
jgi:large subunit ribosomal protein L10